MFEEHFNLKRAPFGRDIAVHALFTATGHREALGRLNYCAGRRLAMVLTGESGVGKSTLLRRFKAEMDPTKFDIFYLPQIGATLRSFYADLLAELRLEAPHLLAKARAAASRALLDRFQTHQRTPVLLLDEAQDMPDTLLDELRRLLNYDCDAFSPFALVLVGHRGLARRLLLRRHEALSGRIQLHFHLTPLSPKESATYVQHQLQAGGADRPIFTEAALTRLAQASGGIPRALNKIAVLCLMSATTSKLDLIDDVLVSQVVDTELMEGIQ